MKHTESQALAKVAAYCSKAERSESDVRRKLSNWELQDDESDRIIERLKKENFLNEKRFCRSFIKDKVRFNKWGKVKIKFELRKKFIPEELINTCLDDIEDDEFESPLKSILITKAKSVKATNEYEKQTKLIRFALGRGYTLDEIKKCLRNTNLSNEDYF